MYHFLSSHNVSYLEYVVIGYIQNKKWLKKNIMKIATDWFITIDPVLYSNSTVTDMNNSFVLYFRDIYDRPRLQDNFQPRVVLQGDRLVIPNHNHRDFETTDEIAQLYGKKSMQDTLANIGVRMTDEEDREFYYTHNARTRIPKKYVAKPIYESISIENENFQKERVGYRPGQEPNYPEADIDYVLVDRVFGEEHIDPGPEDWEYKPLEHRYVKTPVSGYNIENNLNHGMAPTAEFDIRNIGYYAANTDSRIYKPGTKEYHQKMIKEILMSQPQIVITKKI